MNFCDIIVLEPSISKIIVKKKDFSFSCNRSLKMDFKIWPVEIAFEERFGLSYILCTLLFCTEERNNSI